MDVLLLVALCVALTCVLLWAYFTAQRLNSLHIRTDAALASLQSALDRRAAVAAVLAPECAAAARHAETLPLAQGELERRADAESELSSRLNEAFTTLPPELVDADVRVQLAHRFYNEAVSDTRALRLRPVVKALRLGGTAPMPEFFEYTA